MKLYRNMEIECSNDVWVLRAEKLALYQENIHVLGQVLLTVYDLVSGFILHISVEHSISVVKQMACLEAVMRKFGLPKCIVFEGANFSESKFAFLEEELRIQITKEVFYEKKEKDVRLENYLKQIVRTIVMCEASLEQTKKAVSQAIRWNRCFRYEGKVPSYRYYRDLGELVLLDASAIKECFLPRTKRVVQKDGTIHILSRKYDVSKKLIGQEVSVRIDMRERTKAYLYQEEGRFIGVCFEAE